MSTTNDASQYINTSAFLDLDSFGPFNSSFHDLMPVPTTFPPDAPLLSPRESARQFYDHSPPPFTIGGNMTWP